MSHQEQADEPGRDPETPTSLGSGLKGSMLGATFRTGESVDDLGQDRRRDRLAAWVVSGIFVGLGIALGLFLALR